VLNALEEAKDVAATLGGEHAALAARVDRFLANTEVADGLVRALLLVLASHVQGTTQMRPRPCLDISLSYVCYAHSSGACGTSCPRICSVTM